MPTLLLKFGITLEDYNLSDIVQHHGPLFHRWLPDGEKHAIVLDTGDPNAKLKVWFERFGFVGNGYIKFDYKRREIDPKIIPRQAILDAGPLIGLLEIGGVPKEDLVPIEKNKIGDAQYIALGKKIVKKLLYPPVVRFLDILRTNCGQYWIRKLEKWDSRKESLGSYCRSKLQLKWSLDGGKTWKPFVPDKQIVRITATISSFDGYLTEEDWNELAKIVQKGYEPSPAAFILSRTHQFLDEGNLKHALIEGVSALELALNEFISRKLNRVNSLLGSMAAFWQLPLQTQVTSIATIFGKIPLQDIEHTLKAIEMRNKVVHESWNPPAGAKVQLKGLLNTIAALLPGPRYRFPTANPGNALMSAEEWKKRSKKA